MQETDNFDAPLVWLDAIDDQKRRSRDDQFAGAALPANPADFGIRRKLRDGFPDAIT